MFPQLVRKISPALAAAALALVPAPALAQDQPAREPLGLMGTIPIYWGESSGLDELVQGAGEAHWAKAQLEADYDLRPLDFLDAASLAGLDFLLLAQPRVLAPAENVALDAWVRNGGRLLMFADPVMTGHSAFGIGDRRRPQDVVLLSPVLDRWGLELDYYEDQVPGMRIVGAKGALLPVNLPGRFRLAADSPGDSAGVITGEGAGPSCAIKAEGALAECEIGEGSALILADAALLDLHDADPNAPEALAALLVEAFTAEAFTKSGK